MQGEGDLQAGGERNAAGQHGRGGAGFVGAETGYALYRQDGGEFRAEGASLIVCGHSHVPFIGTFATAMPWPLVELTFRSFKRDAFFNFELHAIDVLDESDGIPAALARQQRDVGVPVREKLSRLRRLFTWLGDDRERVTLAEAGPRLGGAFRLAGLQPRRSQITELVEWYERELQRLDVQVLVNHPMDADDVRAFGYARVDEREASPRPALEPSQTRKTRTPTRSDEPSSPRPANPIGISPGGFPTRSTAVSTWSA